MRYGIPGLKGTLVCLLLLGLCVVPPALAGDRAAAARAIDYLHARQGEDGGFSEPGGRSSQFLTGYAIMAIAAFGEDPKLWRPAGRDPLSFMLSHSSEWRSIADYERAAIAVAAAGGNPRRAGGIDLAAKLAAERRADGSIGGAVNTTVWGVFALRACGTPATGKTAAWLKAAVNPDGGWSYARGTASDSNDTAAVIQALRALGEAPGSPVITRALAYIASRQASDGGISYSTFQPDSASDSWTLQALAACGRTPADMTRGGRDPLGHLLSLQRKDGAFDYTEASSERLLWMTCQAMPALMASPFPLAAGSGRPAPFRPAVIASYPVDGGDTDSDYVSISLADLAGGTGIDAASIRVTLDGKPATGLGFSAGALEGRLALPNGRHRIIVSMRDLAGNASRSGLSFTRRSAVTTAPTVAVAAQPTMPVTATSPAALSTVAAEAETVAEEHPPAQRVKAPGRAPIIEDPRILAVALLACAGLLAIIPLLRARRGRKNRRGSV